MNLPSKGKSIICKYCGAANVIKFGTFNGIQRYWCKDCRRKFVAGTLPKMKTDTKIISAMTQHARVI